VSGIVVLSFLSLEVVVVAPFIIVGPVDLPVVVRPFIGAGDTVLLCTELVVGVLLPLLCAFATPPESATIKAVAVVIEMNFIWLLLPGLIVRDGLCSDRRVSGRVEHAPAN
jgi:hypothetical protein